MTITLTPDVQADLDYAAKHANRPAEALAAEAVAAAFAPCREAREREGLTALKAAFDAASDTTAKKDILKAVDAVKLDAK